MDVREGLDQPGETGPYLAVDPSMLSVIKTWGRHEVAVLWWNEVEHDSPLAQLHGRILEEVEKEDLIMYGD